MQRTRPPFRADEVGSLLRPPRIKEARAKLEKGEITAEDLRKAEDLEIALRPPRKCSTAGDGIVIFAVTCAVSHCFFRKRK